MALQVLHDEPGQQRAEVGHRVAPGGAVPVDDEDLAQVVAHQLFQRHVAVGDARLPDALLQGQSGPGAQGADLVGQVGLQVGQGGAGLLQRIDVVRGVALDGMRGAGLMQVRQQLAHVGQQGQISRLDGKAACRCGWGGVGDRQWIRGDDRQFGGKQSVQALAGQPGQHQTMPGCIHGQQRRGLDGLGQLGTGQCGLEVVLDAGAQQATGPAVLLQSHHQPPFGLVAQHLTEQAAVVQGGGGILQKACRAVGRRPGAEVVRQRMVAGEHVGIVQQARQGRDSSVMNGTGQQQVPGRQHMRREAAVAGAALQKAPRLIRPGGAVAGQHAGKGVLRAAQHVEDPQPGQAARAGLVAQVVDADAGNVGCRQLLLHHVQQRLLVQQQRQARHVGFLPEQGLFGLDLHVSLPVSASAALACRSPTA